MILDLSGQAAKLGAYEARLSWDPEVLEVVEVLDGETAGLANLPLHLVFFNDCSTQGKLTHEALITERSRHGRKRETAI